MMYWAYMKIFKNLKLFNRHNIFYFRQAYLASHSSHVNACGNATTSITVEQIHFGSVLGHYQSNESNDMDVDACLKINNYEDTVCQLDMYYGLGRNKFVLQVRTIIN